MIHFYTAWQINFLALHNFTKSFYGTRVNHASCWTILVLFVDFIAIILCSIYCIWFVKYVLSAKKWFVKTSTRILKYESRVVKSNPVGWSLLWNGKIKISLLWFVCYTLTFWGMVYSKVVKHGIWHMQIVCSSVGLLF